MLVQTLGTPGRTLRFTFIVSKDIEAADDKRQASKTLKSQIDALKDRLIHVLDHLPDRIHLQFTPAYPLSFPSGGKGDKPVIQWRQAFGLRKTRATTWNQIRATIDEIQAPFYSL